MGAERRGGTITFRINGTALDAKGNFTYGLGTPKRETLVGADTVHGFTEKPMAPFIEGVITDRQSLDLKSVFNTTAATITVELANGKVFMLSPGWYVGDAQASSEAGEVPVRFEGEFGEEIR